MFLPKFFRVLLVFFEVMFCFLVAHLPDSLVFLQDLLRECGRFWQDLLWTHSFRCGVLSCAKRSQRMLEPISHSFTFHCVWPRDECTIQTHDQVYLECSQRAAEVNNRICDGQTEIVLETVQHKYGCRNWGEQSRHRTQLGATTCAVTLTSVLNAVANWRTRRLTNFRRFPHLVWAITK